MEKDTLRSKVLDTLHRLAPLWVSITRLADEADCRAVDVADCLEGLLTEEHVVSGSVLVSGCRVPVRMFRRRADGEKSTYKPHARPGTKHGRKGNG